MIKVNNNFRDLQDSYLFSRVAAAIAEYRADHPEAKVIRMDIGDVTRPLCKAAVEALHKAADEMADPATFHGYGPEQGYPFLRQAISEHDYIERGLDVTPAEIFISDGAKSDLGNLTDLIGTNAAVGIPDPVYPVYVDSNIIAGNGGKIVYLPCTRANKFLPEIPRCKVRAVYLCFPNNPTGVSITREELAQWVDWAIATGTLIIYDSAYEAFVQSPDAVRSIFEIEGARRVAIECRSFSKTAGFTGLRCGYTVVPQDLIGRFADGTEASLHKMWLRRQSTKFNGASFVVQRAAEALYSPEGREQVAEGIAYYRRNAEVLYKGLQQAGFEVYGGQDSPYIWLRTPGGMDSWKFFHRLLEHCQVAGTPGSGFGSCGEGYLRLTAFNTHEATLEAVDRIHKFNKLHEFGI